MLVRLIVQDYEQWKPVFDELADLRLKQGSLGGQIFRKTDNPKELLVLFQWDNPDQARGYLQLPEVQQAMQRAGVTAPPEVTFLQEPVFFSM